MELLTYWQILIKRWWVIVAMTLLAVVVSFVGIKLIPETVIYQAIARIAVKPVEGAIPAGFFTYDEYYAYLASEYLNDDTSVMVQSVGFLADVRERLKAYPGGPPDGYLRAAKSHRILSITAYASTQDAAMALAQGAVDALMQGDPTGRSYLDRVSNRPLEVAVVDPPAPQGGASTRAQVDLALRALVGLIAGLALAFLLEYVDTSVRDAADAERVLGVPVLGEIPPSRWRRRGGVGLAAKGTAP